MSFVSPLFTKVKKNTQINIAVKWTSALDSLHPISMILQEFLIEI